MTSDASTGDQTWDPDNYNRNARFVSDLGGGVVDLLSPQSGERILDLGCGDGALTVEIESRGATVVGVDASSDQITAAINRGLDARVQDGAALGFNQEFDAVFSNAALHWMLDPTAVIAGVKQALKPGGRFVAEMGGAGNVGAIEGALLAALRARGIDGMARYPWFFPDKAEYGGLLEAVGFTIEYIDLFARPTPLPSEMADWLETFAQPFLNAASSEDRAVVISEVTEAVRPDLQNLDGSWTADYVRLRFRASLT